jgi:hypothetical protein
MDKRQDTWRMVRRVDFEGGGSITVLQMCAPDAEGVHRVGTAYALKCPKDEQDDERCMEILNGRMLRLHQKGPTQFAHWGSYADLCRFRFDGPGRLPVRWMQDSRFVFAPKVWTVVVDELMKRATPCCHMCGVRFPEIRIVASAAINLFLLSTRKDGYVNDDCLDALTEPDRSEIRCKHCGERYSVDRDY